MIHELERSVMESADASVGGDLRGEQQRRLEALEQCVEEQNEVIMANPD